MFLQYLWPEDSGGMGRPKRKGVQFPSIICILGRPSDLASISNASEWIQSGPPSKGFIAGHRTQCRNTGRLQDLLTTDIASSGLQQADPPFHFLEFRF